MIVSFTGTRQGMSTAQKRQLQYVLYGLRTVTQFHHGAAEGADREAAAFAATALKVVAHPAGDDPLARNRELVNICDVLIAAPRTDEEELRSGTWATIRYARAVGKPIIMLSRGKEQLT